MTAQLTIKDGQPDWYLSTDIWSVPGDDPQGPPGTPAAGQTTYLWARVENTGDLDVEGARVDFFWADPTFQVTRTNAHQVGSAYVDLAAGAGPQDVLCLVPWIPVMVNDGHECLVAEVIHPSDALPTPLPDAFDPPTYRQVAQRNLTILATNTPMMITLTLAGGRRERRVRVSVETGAELRREHLVTLGLQKAKPATATAQASLHREPGCPPPDEGKRELDFDVPAGGNSAVYLHVDTNKLRKDEYQVISVVERDETAVLGGIALIATTDRGVQR